MRQGFIAVTVALLLLGSGCADFKSYMRDRGNDLADCFTIRYGYSHGWGVYTQVTNFVTVSVGFYMDQPKWKGYLGRDVVTGGGRTHMGLPMTAPFLGITDLSGDSLDDIRVAFLGINVTEFKDPCNAWLYDTSFIRGEFFIELGLRLFLVGADIGFNPVEFADFVLGWTTLDITGDDMWRKGPPGAEPPEDPAP